ncbi:MAG: hypothetical protein GYA24_17630, partial [Candidatus Lokiarchaeota archaeon]|nr:hypothetical protein [Candidatus Lokiarchaeota archaeon]
ATLENPTATESLFSRAGETGIRFGPTGAPRASIAWADQVIADSTPVNVHPGALSQSIGPTGTTEHGIYITLAQGGKLQWDPRVGIDGILQPDIPPAPPAPIPWETIGLVAAGIAGGVIAGIVIGRAKSGYATRRRVEVLKSNRQGNTRPDEQDASTSKAQDHDSSRSNKTASQVDVDTGNNGESEARGHNSTRSNRTTTKSAPALDGGGSDGGGGGSKVQDHNSSRSNKSSSIATPDADGGNSSDQGKERGITINTSHVEYETKASSDLDYHRPPSLRGDAAQAVNQELHRPPTNRMHDKTSAKLEEPRTTTNKIEALTIKQGVVADAATKVLQGSALSLAEADGLDQLAQKLRYGNPLSDEEIDAIGQILSHNSKAPVDARKVLSRRNSKTMLREGLDKVVKLIERATSGLKDTLKTQV